MSGLTPSQLLRWCLAALALVIVSCATDGSAGESGTLSLELAINGGADIDEVMYVVSGNGIDPVSGDIDVSAPKSTYSVEVFGLPQAKNYQVDMKATTVDKTLTCAGTAKFNITKGETTLVHLVLRCVPPEQFGGVRVNGRVDYCAELISAVASPLQTSIGNDIEVYAVADDRDNYKNKRGGGGGDNGGDKGIEYLWTATGGTIADPTAMATTYTCAKVGKQTITVTVSDDGFNYCKDKKTFAVKCVDHEGPECIKDQDCPAGEICVKNECVPAPPECTDDTQCGVDEICVDNECVPAPPECTDDTQCGVDEICVDNECVPAPPECTDDTQCGVDEICVDNECVPAPPECTDDTQCGVDEICVDNECIPAPPECTDDTQCGVDEICVDNECVPAPPECTDDTQCGVDEICVDNECVPAPPECTDDTQCGVDEICVDNECVPAPPECTDDTQCGVDEICVDNECVPAPPECTDDTQCGVDEICVDNECVAIEINWCAFFRSTLVAPLTQSVGKLIDVRMQAYDFDGDPIEVAVQSDCGEVADPIQTVDPDTGEATTTVRCDLVTVCVITLMTSDTGFMDGCYGLDPAAHRTATINCQP